MSTQLRNRRELFREYIQHLTPGASPRTAVEQGLYVTPPGKTVADRLVPRIDLAPTATHLVVGGIGTGKTTELLRVEEKLRSLPDVVGIYADVSLYNDLSRMQTGGLVAVAGLALDRYLTSVGTEAAAKERKNFRQRAHGHTEWYEEDSNDDQDLEDDGRPFHREVTFPGVLIPPEPPLASGVAAQAKLLEDLVSATREQVAHPVLVFDSLDRMTDLAQFENLVIQDMRAIRKAGIGAVIVGPLAILFGIHRPVADRFDYLYQVPAVDIGGQDGLSFLKQVLAVRVPSAILPDECATSVARFSGGVLRDLMAIGRSAGEEAYLSGALAIELDHVSEATEAFGRDLMLGLTQAQIETLQRVRTHGTFIQTSDEDIALLATRRVLEYGDQDKRYVVHPTIDPLLAMLAEK